MGNKGYRRAAVIVIFIAAALAAIAVAALHFGSQALKRQVEAALGPESTVDDIVVGWSAIEVRGITIKAPKGWPTAHALRAEKVVIAPDLFALVSARVHVPRITIEKAYVSVWRGADGRLRLLPSLLERKTHGADQAAGAGPEISIGRIELRHGALEFFDSTVRRPAHRTRLEQLHATVEDLHLPDLAGRTTVKLDGAVKGVRRDGRLLIDGWAEMAKRNSDITTKLQGVDLLALQPYLIKASETGVRAGSLDLRLKSVVRNNRLHAPGSATISGLELAPGEGPFATFMGVPRSAVLAALKNRKGQITVDFTLEGKLDDPRFSLNESFAARIGSAVAETLGISLEGLTRGVGGAAEGIGGVVRKLFGRP
ncbi:MAG TPA: DUF748 domain-containing protein [Noviherbaspirillum sp.]|jgi:uncharacterized protein involved in outer membrane biogenesis|uniref:DUF748 domain-containing protein n=1 Tax=Noviherbaspirillum sp. TaxID=1926288 RepID=UPI002F91C419